MKKINKLKSSWLFCVVFISSMLGFSSSVLAQEGGYSIIPAFGDKASNQQAPKFTERKRLLFLTTIDFPPFNFINEQKQLTGFNVDLVRALCDELNYKAICQIQALPWQELDAALADNKGDAIISGVAVTKETRSKFLFSDSYFQFPGRFLTLQGDDATSSDKLLQKNIRIASIEGSVQQAYAKQYFKNAIHIAYIKSSDAVNALKKGEVNFYFDDGLRLANMLNNSDIICKCVMIEGAYFSKPYFGEGLAIAFAKGDFELKNAIDWALVRLYDKGIMQEIYLRYFPVGVF